MRLYRACLMVDGVDRNGSWILSDSTDNEPDPHGPIRTAKFFVRGLARRGKLDNTVDTVRVSVEEEDGDTRWEIDVYANWPRYARHDPAGSPVPGGHRPSGALVGAP